MEKRDYYLGLDMGTNSVGWAVTDEQYNLLRAKGKDLWGVRLFDEAKTAEKRRSYRVARRRRQREITRNNVLRDLFADAINDVDPGFYARLAESKYHFEDRSEFNKQKNGIFADKNYTDKDYHKEFPTVFHLRAELLNPDSKRLEDVRLVYLAVANLFSRRGHFLNDSLDSEETNSNISSLYAELASLANENEIELPVDIDTAKLERILGQKGVSRSKINEELLTFLRISKKDTKAVALVKTLAGLEVKLSDILGSDKLQGDSAILKVCFRNSFDEHAPEISEAIDDDLFQMILDAKAIHDIGLLTNIMKGYTYLSQARVDSYNVHHEDLNQLKRLLKKYNQTAYVAMFRKMRDGNYSAYVGSVNSYGKQQRRDAGKKRKQEDLYRTIKSVLESIPDDPDKVDILNKIDAGLFLPKQLTTDNGVIPNQVHSRELRAILKNAEKKHSFLCEKDDTGYTVSEKIIMLFEFRIPYYVGPIGQAHKDDKKYNVWSERKGSDKVYPWNFEDQVDLQASAEKFIERMTRKCTYLTGENTLPKQSLMYERFMVLNEINNIRINGEKLNVCDKQALYNELFLSGKKVSLAKLKAYFIAKNLMTPEGIIGGIDDGCKQSLSSLGKFKGIFGDDVTKQSLNKCLEDIIFWGTVYGDDRKLLVEKIREHYSNVLDESQVKRIAGFKFAGWGNLSKAFLEIEGTCKETGEVFGILQALWETNDNLMELMSDRYTFKETLGTLVHTAEKPLKEWTIDDLEDMYLSAPVKRMVWQTTKIIDELQDVLGCAPKKVFVEMTRNTEEKGVRKESRKKQLSDLYKALGKEYTDWVKVIDGHDEQYFRIKKVYLYYKQMGRCMYTGESIDLNQLLNDNLYDIDHIYPRHFVKDDSLDNNLVLVKKEHNAHKSDTFPIESTIRTNCIAFWKTLEAKKLINKEKLYRLTRVTAFTDEEKAAFISRQLVETAQGSKAITQVLSRAMPNCEIVFSKARLVSDFRNHFNFPKARCVNDLHHAKDAYLNIVVGNVYNVKFTKSPLNFVKDAHDRDAEPQYHYNLDRMFDWDVKRGTNVAWIASKKNGTVGTIATVRSIMNKNSVLVTMMPIEGHGKISEATIVTAKKAKIESYLPVKTSDPFLSDVTKYGGTTSISTSGYCLISYMKKGKEIRSLESLPVFLGRKENLTEEVEKNYFTTVFRNSGDLEAAESIRIIIKFIYQRSLIRIDGFEYYLGGKTSNQIYINSAIQLLLDHSSYEYAHKLEKAVDTNNFEEIDANRNKIITSEKNAKLYDILQSKFTSTIYSKRTGVMSITIDKGKEVFKSLSVENQCSILLSLINNIAKSQKADLRQIEGSPNAGILTIDKKLSNTRDYILVYQSPTGLFKKTVNLWLV